MNESNTLKIIFCITVFIFFFMLVSIFITQGTVSDNEIKEIIVDCYDKEGNYINGVNCTKIRYYCNKFEDFFIADCVGDGE